jgi:hypothetical protein
MTKDLPPERCPRCASDRGIRLCTAYPGPKGNEHIWFECKDCGYREDLAHVDNLLEWFLAEPEG